MFFVVLVFMLLLLVGANVYLYVRLLQSVPPVSLCFRIGLIAVLVLLSLSFVLSIVLRHVDMPVWLSQGLFRVGSVWFLFLLYMIPALLLTDVVHRLYPAFSHGFWVAVLLDVTVLLYGNWKYNHPRVNTLPLSLPGCTAGTPKRIVAISDVHLGEGTGRPSLARYVDMINAQQPDVVLIVGDLVDNSVRPLLRDSMALELKRLRAPMGIYMVPGNHEYISGIHAVRNFLADTPIQLLRDSVVTLPGGIRLVGRDDRMNRHRSTLETLMKKAGENTPTIVMDHQPYELSLADSLGVSLLVCGHTHRGQVWPINWITDAIFEQSHGYRKWSHSHIYVSQGLSLWGPPFRIGTESELVVFEVK